jgi:hypothetical protein
MDGASYDPASRTWAMLRAAPLRPDAQNRQATVWTGTQMVVIQPGAGAAFDPATSSWTTVLTLPQVAGCQPFAIGAEWIGSEVITWVAGRPSAVNGVTQRLLLQRPLVDARKPGLGCCSQSAGLRQLPIRHRRSYRRSAPVPRR